MQDVLRREGRKTAVNPDLMFVGIDQASLGMAETAYKDEAQNNRAFQLMTERPWPWSREIWAIFMDRVFKAGARLVIFDLIFDNPNDGDPAFREALDRYHDKVVLGANIDMAAVRQGGAANVRLPNTVLVPAPQLQDDRVGYVNYFPDPLDNVIRSALYTVTSTQLAGLGIVPDEAPMESMAARALEKLGHGSATFPAICGRA